MQVTRNIKCVRELQVCHRAAVVCVSKNSVQRGLTQGHVQPDTRGTSVRTHGLAVGR